MPRAYRHLTWRTQADPLDTSLDLPLQTLEPHPAHITGYRWVTVARGRPDDMRAIAEALNRARFTLFDIRPVARRKR